MNKTNTYLKYFFIHSIIACSLVTCLNNLAMQKSNVSKLNVNTALARYGANKTPRNANAAFEVYNRFRRQHNEPATNSVENISTEWLAKINGTSVQEYNANLVNEINRLKKIKTYPKRQSDKPKKSSSTLKLSDDSNLIVCPEHSNSSKKKFSPPLPQKFLCLLKKRK